LPRRPGIFNIFAGWKKPLRRFPGFNTGSIGRDVGVDGGVWKFEEFFRGKRRGFQNTDT
jgi:hypothetical protein